MNFISGLIIGALIGASAGIMVSGLYVAANSAEESSEGEEDEQQVKPSGEKGRES